MISAKVIRDSKSAYTGARIVTMVLNYPRFVHAEFMTHRVFSRNASSSRAVPITKQIEMVQRQPVMPIEWGSNKPGMQAGQELDTAHKSAAQNQWVLAMNDAVEHAKKLRDLNVHKQIVNRLLEPFASITVIVTATDWGNFFNLRISPLAQPEIRELAIKMRDAIDKSIPVILHQHEIHAPFITGEEIAALDPTMAMMVSAARCARVSYMNHDGTNPDITKDLVLAEKLRKDKHASVFEHQAIPMTIDQMVRAGGRSRNFRGWYQHRAILGL